MSSHLFRTLRVGCNVAFLMLNCKRLPFKRVYDCGELDYVLL